MYAKLIDNRIQYAPHPLVVDGAAHYHPAADLYYRCGYLEVITLPYPDTDRPYRALYAERDGKIYQEWAEDDTPGSPDEQEPDLDTRVTKLEKETAETQELLDILLTGAISDE